MGIPQNSINTPLEISNDDLLEKLDKSITENNRLKKNNLNLKLQIIEEKEKIQKILSILNINQ
tara:strand:- start:559 stop:747 length:189 start_codon:yes stop_codon:yes gene_type:complete